jgi:Bacterial PH domain
MTDPGRTPAPAAPSAAASGAAARRESEEAAATTAPDTTAAAAERDADGPARDSRADAVRAPRAAGPAEKTVVVRPRKVMIAAWVGAVAVLVLFTVVAVLLRGSETGVYFRFADQVALVVLGLLIAGGVLLLARPRVRADAEGIEVRNILTTQRLSWQVVRRVAFPDGASWARLDLPDDEYLPVLAIQAVDGYRAVEGIARLRALHSAARAS